MEKYRSCGGLVQFNSEKKSEKIIKFDVDSFYPNISEKLMKDSINWARQYIDISLEEENIILEAKNSLLFKDGTPWSKKGDTFFDVGQGSYDRLNVGIYRDDGLGTTPASPRQVEIMKKKKCCNFCQAWPKYNCRSKSEDCGLPGCYF